MTDAEPRDLLRQARVIAAVGLSANPDRPSNQVAWYLHHQGYRLFWVNPRCPEAEVFGVPMFPSLNQVPEPIDIVDVFRRPEHVAGIVSDCIRLKLPALWLQEGVVDQAAAERAVQAGIFTVMDLCIFKERAALPEW